MSLLIGSLLHALCTLFNLVIVIYVINKLGRANEIILLLRSALYNEYNLLN